MFNVPTFCRNFRFTHNVWHLIFRFYCLLCCVWFVRKELFFVWLILHLKCFWGDHACAFSKLIVFIVYLWLYLCLVFRIVMLSLLATLLLIYRLIFVYIIFVILWHWRVHGIFLFVCFYLYLTQFEMPTKGRLIIIILFCCYCCGCCLHFTRL